MIQVSIITVGFKSQDTILPFLDSISKSKDGLTKEIIVVNNMKDEVSDLARNHKTKPTVITNETNLGFSKAINIGLSISKGEYIFILNPDTKLKPLTIKKLFQFASSHKGLGAVAPKLLDLGGKVQASVFRFPTILNAIRKYFFGCKNCFGKYYPGNSTTKVDVAVMAALFIPREVITRLGGLDERFFLYYEDIEYCHRLHQHRLPIYYYPKASVYHQHGASGNFVFHLHSPLLKSSRIYHGYLYSQTLNLVLNIGQKMHKLFRLITKPI